MSAKLGIALLQDDYDGDVVPVMEHPYGLSRAAVKHFSGIDPLREPHRINQAYRAVAERLEMDLLWGSGLPVGGETTYDWSDGHVVKRNPSGHSVVQWGIFGATHQEDGRHFVHVPRPRSVDEALDFQPLEYFPKTVEQYVREFTDAHERMIASCGDACLPLPHHYTTSFHWPLAIFGFELLCEAGLEEPRFHDLMNRFAEITLRISTAWSRVPGLAGFILHDDLAIASGPIFPPRWYREHIFIHYPRLFALFKDAGIPLVFTSDGDCSAFVDDIFTAGADGLNFEYRVDLERLVADWPDKILIGNIDSHTLSHGTPAQIESEVRRCIEIGSRAPRFVVNIGGGLTHDMSIENLEAYLSARKQLCHSVRRASIHANVD